MPKYSSQLTIDKIKVVGLGVLLSGLGAFCTDSYLPSLPAISLAFHVSHDLIKWTISLYLIGFGISQLFYGPFSDRFGRKPVILLGILIGLIGCLISCMSNNIGLLLSGRFIQGIGLGVCNSLFRALFRDTFSGPTAAKMMSKVGIIYAIILAASPAIGGLIQDIWGWRTNLIIQVVLLAIVLGTYHFFLPETLLRNNTKLNVPFVIHSFNKLLHSKTFINYTLCSSFAFAGLVGYLTVSPFIYQITLKLSPDECGLLIAIPPLGLLTGQMLNSFLQKRFQFTDIIGIGIGLLTFGALSLTFSGFKHWVDVPWIVLSVSIYTLGTALVFPNASAAALQPFGYKAGIAAALYGFTQIFTAFLTSAMLSRIPTSSQLPLGLALLILCLIAVFCYIRTRPIQL